MEMFLGLAYSDAHGRMWINGEVKTVSVEHLLGGWPGLRSGDTDELGMALSSGNPEFRQRDSIPDMACRPGPGLIKLRGGIKSER